MPDFLAALIAIVMTFAQGGQPATTPPVAPEETQSRGEQVSVEAKNIETGANSNGGTQPTTTAVGPDTTQVPTDNTAAGIQIPSNVSKVAVDNSPVLVDSTETLPNPGDITSEVSATVVEVNENTDFGQAIADNLPDSAKTDGQAFGEETSNNAPYNSRRP